MSKLHKNGNGKIQPAVTMIDPTIDEAVNMYLSVQVGMKSPNTLNSYQYAFRFLQDFFGGEQLARTIEQYEVQQFRSHLFAHKRYSGSDAHKEKQTGKTLAPSTIKSILKSTRALFNWLQQISAIDNNPFKTVKMPVIQQNEPRAISPKDFEKLVDQIMIGVGRTRPYEDSYKARDLAILLFFGSTACRVSGISTAKLSNLQIDDDGGTVVVNEKFPGGPRSRTTFLSERAAIAMLDWMDHRPITPDHDFIFTGLESRHRGAMLQTSGYRQLLERYAGRVNELADFKITFPIESFTNPHAFRHACAKHWLSKGMSLPETAKIMGCTEEIVMKYYARYANHEVQQRHREISKLLNR